jgi:hypothetical protein
MAKPKTDSRTFAGERQVVWDAALEAARQGGMKVKQADADVGLLELSKGTSMRTWGEAIEFRVEPGADGQVVVTGTARAKYQVVDWGQSQKTLDAFFFRLERILR